jgi:hypothetical protein
MSFVIPRDDSLEVPPARTTSISDDKSYLPGPLPPQTFAQCSRWGELKTPSKTSQRTPLYKDT